MKMKEDRESTVCKGDNEDEDDLEALRLAALESLRAKGLPPPLVTGFGRAAPVRPIPQVFQRHAANQNLIAIVPVEVPTIGTLKADPPAPDGPPVRPAPVIANPVRVEVPLNMSCAPKDKNEDTKLVLPQQRYLINTDVDESDDKPKSSTKFSRFEDSESDESDQDEIEISYTQSESDEEAEEIEIVIMDDGVEASAVDNGACREASGLEPATSPVPGSVPDAGKLPPEKEESVPGVLRKQSSPKTVDYRSPKRDSPARTEARRSPRRISPSRMETRRSPKRDSPSRTERRRSPRKDSPSRTETRRTPRKESPARIEARRSPRRDLSRRLSPSGYRKLKRNADVVEKRPDRSGSADPYRSNRSEIRRIRGESGRNKAATRSSSLEKCSDRRGDPDEKRRRTFESRLAEDRESRRNYSPDRSVPPSGENRRKHSPDRPGDPDRDGRRKPSPDRPNLSAGEADRDARKKASPDRSVSQLSDAERERLESRKRKFESGQVVHPSKVPGGKIRLKLSDSDDSGSIHRPRSDAGDPTRSNGHRPSPEADPKDHRTEKKSKKDKKKKKDKSKRPSDSKGRYEDKEPRPAVDDVAVEPSVQDRQLDLRAELQRRRNHRVDDEEPARQVRTTPEKSESRRILVLKSPPAEGTKSKDRTVSRTGSSSRSGGHLVAKVQVQDQGRDPTALEDRIRQIRAKNDEIRRRQMEVEADRLKYA